MERKREAGTKHCQLFRCQPDTWASSTPVVNSYHLSFTWHGPILALNRTFFFFFRQINKQRDPVVMRTNKGSWVKEKKSMKVLVLMHDDGFK